MFLALYILPVFPFDFSFAHEDSLGTRLVTANAVRTVFNQPQFLLLLSLFLRASNSFLCAQSSKLAGSYTFVAIGINVNV